MPSKKKKYFANNYRAVSEIPASDELCMEFDEFMINRVGGWDIPSSIVCIIRVQDIDTKKVSEFSYQRHHAAKRKVMELQEKRCEITIADEDTIHWLVPGLHDEDGT